MANPINKKKKVWQETPKLTRFYKGLIATAIFTVLFLIFFLWPKLTRDYYVKNLKLAKEVFLVPPMKIDLISTGEFDATYNVTINGIDFKIPEFFTPVRIGENSIEFRAEPRREAREIYIKSQKSQNVMSFTITGFTRWFMPSTTFEFLKVMLRATWHPLRLMYKSMFYISEGITGRIFEGKWSKYYHGFITPTVGEKGYMGRVFCINSPGYFEFLYQDTIHPIALREWIDLAVEIKMPEVFGEVKSNITKEAFNLGEMLEKVSDPKNEAKILGDALSEFFRTKKGECLIPVARVMENRGFFPELIELYQQHISSFESNFSTTARQQNKMIDDIIANIVHWEVTPVMNLNKLNVFCRNQTGLAIEQVRLKVNIKARLSEYESFVVPVLTQGKLYANQEKNIIISLPENVSLSDNLGIDCKVVGLDFVK